MLRRRTILAGAVTVPLLACAREETRPMGTRHEYGTDPAQYGTLHRPPGASRGVIAVIHGGFWRAAYDASLGTPLAQDLAARGWTAWNLEYRRVGEGGGVPATLDDVAAGIDKLTDLGVDTSTVVTLGHSAGGHLATWAASRGRFERWSGGVEVTHVVSQAGVLNLAVAADEQVGDGAVIDFCGGEPAAAPGAYHWADPAPQIPLEVPVWCVHAADDVTVPIRQSRDYVTQALAAGARAELVQVGGAHFDVIDVQSQAWSQIVGILDGIG